MTILYHGSYISVPSPLTGVGRRELDFGPGFYLTNLRDQAERWARRVCVIRALDTPTLSSYEFDETQLPTDVRCLRLEHYDQEWLDFIVSSRRGEEPWKNYDIIEGGVANDQVIDTVEDYYAGRITAEQAIGQLCYAKPTHQMCISNQNIVDSCLCFVIAEPVEEEGGQG
ncbi:MAG: DUF3990 domain-containing protein [Bacteroidaceae bacterium]|nr:DUF3990 domain-containing protein [Bacteroidaceae bacterium]